ncbi:hypothetical protein RJ639_032964 [Escallonia herrerae]|uniref:Uncharacterized protein n=1 Tax=Escallonia herrerae TaxID=1293975 RepID=A0AA88WUT8_9ASTE|nr:hypothetical protein RJ639_032964 [Escallonia herrerae]
MESVDILFPQLHLVRGAKVRGWVKLRRSNPNTIVEIQVDNNGEQPVFERISICLGGLKKAFLEQCRLVIGLDECFFEGVCEEHILITVEMSANNGMFPVAYRVAEVEFTSTLTWFLERLAEDLRIDDSGWIFLSDKQKGLLNALQKVVPNTEQRKRAKNMFENYKTVGFKILVVLLLFKTS